jgi:hypothetical protein
MSTKRSANIRNQSLELVTIINDEIKLRPRGDVRLKTHALPVKGQGLATHK